MSKVVVFGGSGFLGSHVADELSIRGFNVVIFDISNSKFINTDQEMIIGNILDREAVKRVVQGSSFVFHFAAIADIQEAKENPVEAANYNIIGTMNILDACREHNVKRFIYSSTIYVYSEHGSFYRSTKQACELFIENYQKEYGLDFTILRYGSLYGKRANNFNFIKNSIRQALIEGKITRKGDGEEIRDYINIIDAAKSTVDSLEDTYRNGYLMITGPQTMKVKELLMMIKEILNNKVEIEYNNVSNDGHYRITPYSFKPKVAMKISNKEFHDLGQGILDIIYTIYEELIEEGITPKFLRDVE